MEFTKISEQEEIIEKAVVNAAYKVHSKIDRLTIGLFNKF